VAVPYTLPYTPAVMQKTSVYLDREQAEHLARVAREEGRSQAAVLRDAIAMYRPRPTQDRNFALSGIGRGGGTSIADVPEEELLEGFGE
jgi:hypothetical protein